MRRENYQLTPYNGHIERFSRHDPFQQIQQMLMSFGGLHNDPFLSGMMGIGDPFEDIFKFSDVHKNVHERGAQGSYVFQSFVSSSRMGPDGRVIRENYFENNMGEHRAGNTISQKQQAYKNTEGVNRIAQERMLNDRGRKIVRQKIGQNVEETNHYYNIDEEESQKFDSEWRQANTNMKFLQNHQRQMRQIGTEYQQPQMQIGYQPATYQNTNFQEREPSQQQQRTQSVQGISYETSNRFNPQSRTSQYSIPNITFNNMPRRY